MPFHSPPVGGAVLNLTDHRLPGSAGPLSLGAGVGRVLNFIQDVIGRLLW